MRGFDLFSGGKPKEPEQRLKVETGRFCKLRPCAQEVEGGGICGVLVGRGAKFCKDCSAWRKRCQNRIDQRERRKGQRRRHLPGAPYGVHIVLERHSRYYDDPADCIPTLFADDEHPADCMRCLGRTCWDEMDEAAEFAKELGRIRARTGGI